MVGDMYSNHIGRVWISWLLILIYGDFLGASGAMQEQALTTQTSDVGSIPIARSNKTT